MNLLESHQNSIIKHLVKLGECPRYRKESSSAIIESKKIILEAIKLGLIKNIFLQKGLEISAKEPITYITESLTKKISSLKSPDGYFAEIKYPNHENPHEHQKLLILDQIQDPGNLGTLCRSAHAFGFNAIILIKGACDPYSPKVIRSSMGSTISMPIYFFDYAALKTFLKDHNYNTLVADIDGKDLSDLKPQIPYALILGNESKGSILKDELSFSRVCIPIKNVNSLNVGVAGSILMSQMSSAL